MSHDRFATPPFVADLFQVPKLAIASLDVIVGSRFRALGERLRGIRAKVNLMAFNPHAGAPYERPAILFREPIEVVAAVCVNGKTPPSSFPSPCFSRPSS